MAVRNSRKPRTSNVKKKTTSFLGGKHQQARCREEDVKAPIASLPMYIARPVILCTLLWLVIGVRQAWRL